MRISDWSSDVCSSDLLVRGPDGVWRVIADRTQAPAGAGYALQNRRVMSRVMGQALRQCRVRPLNTYFEYWQADLAARAPTQSDNPRVVLLTPGPYNGRSEEHTSELQSLMRISYSVMCLKKKNIILKKKKNIR